MCYDTSSPTSSIFWGEISPCEHIVQIYQHDDIFMDALEGWVAGGLKTGDAVVVIATEQHRSDLEARLRDAGIDLDLMWKRDRFICLDAEQTLAKFVVGDTLDPVLFRNIAVEILKRARGGGGGPAHGGVRAFGEMVAVLWAQGKIAATVALEQQWHKLCAEEAFSLLCAYPKVGFTENLKQSVDEICAAHSKVLDC